jgi:hypothetical protein
MSTRLRLLAPAVAVALVLAGCSGGSASEPGTTPSTASPSPASTSPASTSPSAAPTTSPSPSGSTGPAYPAVDLAGQLSGFVAAARRVDGELRAAARLVNAGIGTTSVRIEAATVGAIRAIDPRQEVLPAIPGGLDATALGSILEVYAGLWSRRASFLVVEENLDSSPLPRPGDEVTRMLGCLAHGSAAAASFETDLARVLAVAAGRPPIPVPAPDSRAAAEVAIRAHTVQLPNTCAEECGGYVPRPVPMPAITWQRATLAPGSIWDGRVGTAYFHALYVPGQGWEVRTNAC